MAFLKYTTGSLKYFNILKNPTFSLKKFFLMKTVFEIGNLAKRKSHFS